jgi:hypothetical protein
VKEKENILRKVSREKKDFTNIFSTHRKQKMKMKNISVTFIYSWSKTIIFKCVKVKPMRKKMHIQFLRGSRKERKKKCEKE